MSALVVYESMFGNTQSIAKDIADGISSHMSVELVEVGDALEVMGADVELRVVGDPTHAFGMSRPKTRTDAAGQAGNAVVSKGDRRARVARPRRGLQGRRGGDLRHAVGSSAPSRKPTAANTTTNRLSNSSEPPGSGQPA